jgi:DNA (cytosine-5)-methyltransferase 1
VQADAVEFARAHGHEFDAIHASPPCQKHAKGLRGLGMAKGGAGSTPASSTPSAKSSRTWAKPYVIENVVGSPLHGVTLCGTSFELPVRRHRLFETSFLLLAPDCRCKHPAGISRPRCSRARPQASCRCTASPRAGEVELRREAMQMPWASDYGLSQAIPPAYTRFIGAQLLEVVQARRELAVAA